MENKKRKTDKLKIRQVHLKSTQLVSDLEKKYFEDDNNFIDYFMEVGVKPEIFKNSYLYESTTPEEINENLVPQIISKFPNFDKKNVVVENTMIHQIFPQGFKAIESDSQPKPYFYCLVLDNQLYSAIYTRKYLSCLIIYESIGQYKKLNDKFEDREFSKLCRQTTRDVKSNLLIFKHKKFYIPKCLCIVSLHPYIDKFEEILRTIYEIVTSNNYPSLFIDYIIEKLVIETPKIPRGLTKVFLKFHNKEIELTEKKMNEYPSVNINLSHVFELLSYTNVIEIYKFLLYETKLIFFSENLFDLTNTILTFLTLLSPFNYQFQIVSILPKELYNFIETVSPYIFGVNEKYSENFFKKNKISIESTTICIIDIDTDNYYLIAPGGELNPKDFPEIPKKLKKKLEERLKKKFSKKPNEIENNENNNNFSNKESSNFNTNNTTSTNINPNNVTNDSNSNSLVCETTPATSLHNSFNRFSFRKKRSAKPENKNELIQVYFFKFLIKILKDYPRFLSKDYSVSRDISMSIKDMIDIESYLKIYNNEEKIFYERIFNTQMFIEFIYKRMMPKDCNEKVEVLFFEEKINEKIARNIVNIFKKSSVPQNVLLPSKDYDFDEDEELKIDLCPEYTVTENLIKYIYNNKETTINGFLNKGIIINLINIEDKKEDKLDLAKNPITFNYVLFPCIFSEKLFIFNQIDYNKGSLPLYKAVEEINTKIVNKCSLKFIQRKNVQKNSEGENDLYICYLILWTLVYWYIKEEERNERFLKMLEMLEKVEEHDIKIYDLLFKVLVDSGNENDENVIILYKKFINFRLNPSWDMFSLVSKIIKKKQNKSKKQNMLHQDITLKELKEKFIKENKIAKNAVENSHTLRIDEIDDSIFTDELAFYAFATCKKCGKNINLAQICSNMKLLKTEKDADGIEHFVCCNKTKEGICGNLLDQKLKFRYGSELFNLKDNFIVNYNYSTSTLNTINLYTPNQLKENLYDIANSCVKDDKHENFQVEEFRNEYPDIFWSLIWYFSINKIDNSIMLPYSNNSPKKKEVIHILNPNIKNFYSIKEKKYDDNLIIEDTDCRILRFIKAKTKKKTRIMHLFKLHPQIHRGYDSEDLCIQNVHEIAILDNSGIFNLKNISLYEKNISSNEVILLPFDKDNNSTCCGSILGNDRDTMCRLSVVRDTVFSQKPINRMSTLLHPKIVKIATLCKSGPGLGGLDLFRESNVNSLTKCIVFEESEDEENDDKK